MLLSDELEQSLKKAFLTAKERKHEFITPEHILYVFLYDLQVSKVLYECGADIDLLKEDLEHFFKEIMHPLEIEDPPEPTYSRGSQFLLEFASLHVISSNKEKIGSSNILAAMYRDQASHAVYFLEKQNVTRLDIIKYISHGISKRKPQEIPDEGRSSQGEFKDSLAEFCVELNQKALEGKIDPLIGRQNELERTIHILARRRKNNPIFVGDAGVGKTAIVEGLAQRIVDQDVPSSLKDLKIYSIDMGALTAGTRFRGDFEERLRSIIKKVQKDKNSVLFIDEIHTVVGAGAVSAGSLDASNMLKPTLANGEIRCIGTTTAKEYRSVFERDHALARRFQRINVSEPTQGETFQILKGSKKYYEEFHRVRYSDSALKAAVELTSKYINDRRLPDKAIDIIDEAGAAQKIKRDLKTDSDTFSQISIKDIENMVSRTVKIPARTVKTDDREKLKNLSDDLKKVIFGQDQAIESLVTSIQMSRAGLNDQEKPIGSFLFAGPTGVGKTELSKQLAQVLGVEFIRFDMSEYMERHTVSRLIGSPPGYVGFDQGGQLTEAVHRNPYAVLLLDEIEKAHEEVYNILLQVMDHATLTDTNGRKVDFKQVILIMTTNEGARESMRRSVGFDAIDYEDQSAKAIERYFNPEFRNRLSSIIQFMPLDHELIKKVVRKILRQLEEKLKSKRVKLMVTEPLIEYLAKKGYDPQMGARTIQRLMDTQLAQKIAREILFGKLALGGSLKVDLSKDESSEEIIIESINE